MTDLAILGLVILGLMFVRGRVRKGGRNLTERLAVEREGYTKSLQEMEEIKKELKRLGQL